MYSSLLADYQGDWSSNTITGQTILQQQSFFDRIEPALSQNIDTAEWWRTMQNMRATSESNSQQTNELVQEIAEWSSIMENMFANDLTTTPSHLRQDSRLDGIIEQSLQLEERICWLRGVFRVLFTLWKIAASRQLSLLEENQKLMGRTGLALMLKQMSVHHSRISQSLAHDTESLLSASIVNDVASLEVLTANLSHLTRHTDLSPSASSRSRFAYTPTEIPDVSHMIPQSRPQIALAPPRQSPSVLSREFPASQEIPMPRFLTSQSLESVQQDHEALWMSL